MSQINVPPLEMHLNPTKKTIEYMSPAIDYIPKKYLNIPDHFHLHSAVVMKKGRGLGNIKEVTEEKKAEIILGV